MRHYSVIPSEVENGAAGKPRHGREGRRLSEREVSESNPVALPCWLLRGIPRLRFAPLGMTGQQ